MKLCIDCKYCQPSWNLSTIQRFCIHPKRRAGSRVTGETLCESERSFGLCSYGGWLWEQAEQKEQKPAQVIPIQESQIKEEPQGFWAQLGDFLR